MGGKLHVGASKAAERVKKLLRDNDAVVTPDIRRALLLECCDVLWYLSAIASRLNSSLEEVATLNHEKLMGRVERGTLKGSGDDR